MENAKDCLIISIGKSIIPEQHRRKKEITGFTEYFLQRKTQEETQRRLWITSRTLKEPVVLAIIQFNHIYPGSMDFTGEPLIIFPKLKVLRYSKTSLYTTISTPREYDLNARSRNTVVAETKRAISFFFSLFLKIRQVKGIDKIGM